MSQATWKWAQENPEAAQRRNLELTIDDLRIEIAFAKSEHEESQDALRNEIRWLQQRIYELNLEAVASEETMRKQDEEIVRLTQELGKPQNMPQVPTKIPNQDRWAAIINELCWPTDCSEASDEPRECDYSITHKVHACLECNRWACYSKPSQECQRNWPTTDICQLCKRSWLPF